MPENQLTRQPLREIIEDFAEEINRRKQEGPKPSTTVIPFRNDLANREERPVEQVPTELLRFRKDNGRIASDVLGHEKSKGPLQENTKDAQQILRGFLEASDPQKRDDLKKSIQSGEQREPAIITADGFLVNGNRRKMVLEQLEKSDQKFKYMKVVILPGKGDPGGPPTVKEIEQIENRCQLQSDGKSEYDNFNKALSTRRKIKCGMTLEEQLKDDSKFALMSGKEFETAVRKYKKEFLDPLELIDVYLNVLERDGHYPTISAGTDRGEGRWQAFVDWSKALAKLKKEIEQGKTRVREDEIGDVQDLAFKIIRGREFPGIKAHEIMRNLPKWLADKEAKKELLKLKDIPWALPPEECRDRDGREYPDKEKDKRWAEKHKTELIGQVKKTQKIFDRSETLESPLELLDAAFKKLTHDNMHSDILPKDLLKAMQLAQKVQDEAKELQSRFYHRQKDMRKGEDQLKARIQKKRNP